MRIIAISRLKAFWKDNPDFFDAEEPTLAWYRQTEKADWDTPNAVKKEFGNASILKDSRVVFNIAGNKYRLIVKINYPYKVVYIRFIGTHAEYDKIDVDTI
ncbi:MAG: putative membrane protein [uncultured Thiotrichaceae bacterium]|uniref:Putative membrane protein n=1 Tax=uncultured Thiotrichaceae bacterium TaxID=298394 RepID=A0A6S6TBU1_9GAMM|nr:MAG: putative membrane protein [uncultured Thiotrichaceae bacterium]